MNYRKEIDGLRAFAVLSVIFFHAGFEIFSGGFVGVDVFFVISGYLITTIILLELEQGKFSIINFYERRARRILPALFLVMFVCIPFAWFLLLPVDMKDFTKSLKAVSLFMSNHLFLSQSGYFDAATELKPLLHTWSLAVEEQYYFFFPIFLIFFWRFGKRWIILTLALLFVVSFSLAQWMTHKNSLTAFYLLPTRIWELFVGVFAAFYFSYFHRKDFDKGPSELGGCLGFMLILYAVFSYSSNTPFPGLYALVPTLGTLLVIFFATQQTYIGRFIGGRTFVLIGLISYSAYLWHQPIFAFYRYNNLTESNKSIFFVLILVVFFLAYLTWKYVENPFRKTSLFSRRFIFSFSAIACVVFVSMGVLGNKFDGFKNRLPNAANFSGDQLPRIDNGWCFYSIDNMSSLKFGVDGLQCFVGDKTSKVKGILFGDSYAGHYEPLWDTVGKSASLNINAVTTNWCYPSIEEKFTGPANSRAFKQCLFNRKYLLENYSEYDFVILSGSWGSVFAGEQLDGALELIRLLSSKVKVVVIMPAPKEFDANPLHEYRRAIWFRYDFDIKKIGTVKDKNANKANQILRTYSKKFSNVIYVDRDLLFSNNGVPADITSDGIPFSFDGGHISTYGSLKAATNFLGSDPYIKFNMLLR